MNEKYCKDCVHVINKTNSLLGINYWCEANRDLVTGNPVACKAIRSTVSGADCPDYEKENDHK